MEIHVVSEKDIERELWASLLSNTAFLDLKVIGNDAATLEFKELSSSELIIFISDSFNDHLKYVIEQCIDSEIPILCVTDKIEEHEYTELIHRGVKGILNGKKSSLAILKTAIRVVSEGGTYLERPIFNSKLCKQKKLEPLF